MARDRSKKKSVVFDPPKAFPMVSKAFTATFCLQLVWVGYIVWKLELLAATIAATLAVALAILITERSAEIIGGYISTRVLANEPFSNPLAVPVTPAEIKEAAGKPSKTMIKFKSQFWQLLIHVFMAGLETVVLQQTAEAAGGDLFTDPWRCSLYEQPNPPLLQTVYLVQMAVWIVTAVFHIWVFETQSDYFIMLLHHIVTIGLVAISWQNNFVRYGLMVLWVHDLSDIPIDLLKLTNYLQLESAKGFFLVEISFFSCLASWAYLRIFLYPVQVVYKAAYFGLCGLYDHTNIIAWDGSGTEQHYCPTSGYEHMRETQEHWSWLGKRNGEEYPYPAMQFWATCTVVLLSVLFLMHIWWYFLFLRILKGIIYEGAHEAGRQEYEGDDEKAKKELQGKDA